MLAIQTQGKCGINLDMVF